MKHPITNKLVVSSKEIKEVTLEFCKGILTKNPIREGFEEEINMKKILHKERMKENIDNVKINKETYKKVLEKLKKNNKRNYDFLIKSSDTFKEVVNKFISRMIRDVGEGKENDFPRDFKDTTLHQIFKKGDKNDLASFRYIHSKTWLPHTVDAVIVEEMKEQVIEASTPYQIGGL